MKKLPVVQREMIEEFQCIGCMLGGDTKCGSFELQVAPHEGGFRCSSHTPGTGDLGGLIVLGLPKGFFRIGEMRKSFEVVLWSGGTPKWNHLNVPVWALVKDGFMFVRTYRPRVNTAAVDVIRGGTLDMCPQAIDVGTFYSNID